MSMPAEKEIVTVMRKSVEAIREDKNKTYFKAGKEVADFLDRDEGYVTRLFSRTKKSNYAALVPSRFNYVDPGKDDKAKNRAKCLLALMLWIRYSIPATGAERDDFLRDLSDWLRAGLPKSCHSIADFSEEKVSDLLAFAFYRWSTIAPTKKKIERYHGDDKEKVEEDDPQPELPGIGNDLSSETQNHKPKSVITDDVCEEPKKKPRLLDVLNVTMEVLRERCRVKWQNHEMYSLNKLHALADAKGFNVSKKKIGAFLSKAETKAMLKKRGVEDLGVNPAVFDNMNMTSRVLGDIPEVVGLVMKCGADGWFLEGMPFNLYVYSLDECLGHLANRVIGGDDRDPGAESSAKDDLMRLMLKQMERHGELLERLGDGIIGIGGTVSRLEGRVERLELEDGKKSETIERQDKLIEELEKQHHFGDAVYSGECVNRAQITRFVTDLARKGGCPVTEWVPKKSDPSKKEEVYLSGGIPNKLFKEIVPEVVMAHARVAEARFCPGRDRPLQPSRFSVIDSAVKLRKEQALSKASRDRDGCALYDWARVPQRNMVEGRVSVQQKKIETAWIGVAAAVLTEWKFDGPSDEPMLPVELGLPPYTVVSPLNPAFYGPRQEQGMRGPAPDVACLGAAMSVHIQLTDEELELLGRVNMAVMNAIEQERRKGEAPYNTVFRLLQERYRRADGTYGHRFDFSWADSERKEEVRKKRDAS